MKEVHRIRSQDKQTSLFDIVRDCEEAAMNPKTKSHPTCVYKCGCDSIEVRLIRFASKLSLLYPNTSTALHQ